MNDPDQEQTNLNTLPTASAAVDPDPDLEANLTSSVRLSRPSCDPRGHMPRSQANPRAHEQRAGTPNSSIAANAIPEQDVGVRHGTEHFEEDIGLNVEFCG